MKFTICVNELKFAWNVYILSFNFIKFLKGPGDGSNEYNRGHHNLLIFLMKHGALPCSHTINLQDLFYKT